MDTNPILIGEDDDNEALLLRKALQALGLKIPVNIVPDGQEVVDYLSGVGRYEDRENYPFPSALFTDLKMPRMDGFDVLRWMRKYPERAITPTLVFSSSNEPEDIKLAYELGAHAYMVKPTRFEDLTEMLRTTCQFWKWCAKPKQPTSPSAF